MFTIEHTGNGLFYVYKNGQYSGWFWTYEQAEQYTQFTGYRSMLEVQDRFHHFFSPGAVQGFGSRIESALYGGRYFVTSERTFDNSGRRYTVREATQDDIVNVGEFQQYRTRGQAIAAIEELLAPVQLELEEGNE